MTALSRSCPRRVLGLFCLLVVGTVCACAQPEMQPQPPPPPPPITNVDEAIAAIRADGDNRMPATDFLADAWKKDTTNTGVRPRLRALLHDPDAKMRANVLCVLCNTHDYREWDTITPYVKDPDADVRTEAVGVLPYFWNDTWEDANAPDATAVKDFQALHKGELDAIAKRALADPAPLVRYMGADFITKCLPADKALPLLLTLAHDPDEDVRGHLADDLSGFVGAGNADALAAMLALMKDDSPHVRGSAAGSLGFCRDAKDAIVQIPEAIQPLIGMLSDPNARVVRDAAQSLGFQEDARAVPALCAALKSPDEDARKEVIDALGRIADPSAIPALATVALPGQPEFDEATGACLEMGHTALPQILPLLRDPLPARRLFAVAVLAGVPDKAATDGLASLLADPDDSVRREAALALGVQGDNRATPALVAMLSSPDEETLYALDMDGDDSAIPALVNAYLHTHNDDVRDNIGNLLWELDNPGATTRAGLAVLVPPPPDARTVLAVAASGSGARPMLTAMALWTLLDHSRGPIIAAAAQMHRYNMTSTLSDSPSSVDSLALKVNDPNIDHVRLQAIGELGESKDPRAIDILRGVLADKDQPDNIKEDTIYVLSENGSDAAFAVVRDILQDRNQSSELRVDVVDSLTDAHKDRATADLLAEMLNDGDVKVRTAALACLAFNFHDHRALSAAVNMLDDPDQAKTAARDLQYLGDKQAADPLAACLGNPKLDASAHLAVAYALAALGDQRAVQPLLDCLADASANDYSTWRNVCSALAKLPPAQALPGLLALYKKSGDYNLLPTLGALDTPEVADILAQAMKSNNPGMRAAAAKALGKRTDDRSLALWQGATRDPDSSVRQAAASAVAHNTLPAVTQRVTQMLLEESTVPMQSGWNPVRQEILDDLWKRTDDDACDSVIAFVQAPLASDTYFHDQAVRTLGDMHNLRTIPTLIDLLTGPAPLRFDAENSLVEITGQNLGRDPAAWRVWWAARKP